MGSTASAVRVDAVCVSTAEGVASALGGGGDAGGCKESDPEPHPVHVSVRRNNETSEKRMNWRVYKGGFVQSV
jgi:hypothetical protein